MKTSVPLLVLVALFAVPLGACAQKRPAQVPEGTRMVLDLPYVSNAHPNQRLDLYLPAKPLGPLLVWIHGGGWRAGSKSNPNGLAALEHGVAVASIEYRFSQHAIFPAQIEDCKAAIRWLRAKAPEYGYDPKRIAVWGASAGGHLAAMLAVTGHTRDFDVGENLDQPSTVQCAVNWYGPADFPAYDPGIATPTVQRENPASVLAQLLGGPMSQKLELARRASPVTWVTKQAAPLLIMQGTNDSLVPANQAERLAERLQAVGADVTLDILPGAGHGGPAFTTPEKVELIMNFFARHLAPQP